MNPRLRLFLSAERAFGLESIRSSGQPDGAEVQLGATVETRAAVPPRAQIRPTQQPAANYDATMRTPVVQPILLSPFTAPILSKEKKQTKLVQLDESQVRGCPKCRLCETRTKTVFGEGDVDAQLMFIGEGPGENEDLSGRPFVGRAGQLLDKMIAAMGLQREQTYIANIVKCRPPNNRAPMPDETAACTPYLMEQIETVRPKVIVTLGLPATRFILQLDLSMGKMRGQFHDWRGLKIMPTYHPSYVLRSYTPQTRAAVWSDLQQVMGLLGLKGSAKKTESI